MVLLGFFSSSSWFGCICFAGQCVATRTWKDVRCLRDSGSEGTICGVWRRDKLDRRPDECHILPCRFSTAPTRGRSVAHRPLRLRCVLTSAPSAQRLAWKTLHGSPVPTVVHNMSGCSSQRCNVHCAESARGRLPQNSPDLASATANGVDVDLLGQSSASCRSVSRERLRHGPSLDFIGTNESHFRHHWGPLEVPSGGPSAAEVEIKVRAEDSDAYERLADLTY